MALSLLSCGYAASGSQAYLRSQACFDNYAVVQKLPSSLRVIFFHLQEESLLEHIPKLSTYCLLNLKTAQVENMV